MKHKVCWITLCKNEQDIIPFCIDYWKRIADKVIVFDNDSTDNSIDLLKKEKFIEVRHFDSNGQNDFIQREVKQKAFQEFKNDYDIIIITDMDEVFYFDDFKALVSEMIDGGYSILATPIYSLCEDFRPKYEQGKYLHQLCHKFYKQRMNHMSGLDGFSKLSIFNTKAIDSISLSVGQHIVRTSPSSKILKTDKGFNLHIDKGLGEDYYVQRRKKMANNLSDINKQHGFCIEYSKTEEESRREYKEHQSKSFNLNELIKRL